MARTSRAEKERTRQRLVATAGREFRSRGMAGTSIPRVMERIGLTQGTFYAHFASKDALAADAVGSGLAEMVDGLLGAPADAAPTRDLAAVIARYLSAEHRDDVAGGCVLPALAGEIRREPDPVRQVFTRELAGYFARLTPLLPDADANARADHALTLVAGMAGAVLLARAVDDPALSDRILRTCREYYAGAFAPRPDGETASADEEDAERR